ncbi:hypothetical protein [Hymenobacter metallicola]|uniref:Lipocalin-like domain-containing protein n=1 Tax=Hymenobacter metallicola TaxID=2563114 RepID=A0A4Z0PWW8_9BACT|nr:hypothetical protein [Hymenobacter metallicola]TGE20902.1 hypothetical protein E5K02_25205 [Hymenobacter metallicola]
MSIPRFLSFFLLCLTLLTAACKKDTTEPEPTLEGRWNFESMTEHSYQADGTHIKAAPASMLPHYVVVTTTEFSAYHSADNTLIMKSGYTRQGNHIHFLNPSYSGDVTITEVSKQRLTMLSDKIPYGPQGGYLTLESTFTH